MIAYGPVPSRRLGQSLGINNIPPKVCTYSCVYCQVGRTIDMQAERSAFYEPDDILKEVESSVQKAVDAGERIDYLTFVPDGEPTLDLHLGREIEMLQHLERKIAVITNSSLIARPDVRDELMKSIQCGRRPGAGSTGPIELWTWLLCWTACFDSPMPTPGSS